MIIFFFLLLKYRISNDQPYVLLNIQIPKSCTIELFMILCCIGVLNHTFDDSFHPEYFQDRIPCSENIEDNIKRVQKEYLDMLDTRKTTIKERSLIEDKNRIIIDLETKSEFDISSSSKISFSYEYKQFGIYEQDLSRLSTSNMNKENLYLNDNIIMYFAKLLIDSSPRKDDSYLMDSINFNEKYDFTDKKIVDNNSIKYFIAPVCIRKHWYLVVYSKYITMIFDSMEYTLYPIDILG